MKHKFTERDEQVITYLYNEGKGDAAIARILGLGRSEYWQVRDHRVVVMRLDKYQWGSQASGTRKHKKQKEYIE